MRKKIFLSVITFISIFIFKSNIIAGNFTKTAMCSNSTSFDDNTTFFEKTGDCTIWFYIKKINNENAYCISGWDVSAPADGSTCSLDNTYSDEYKIEFANIISSQSSVSDVNRRWFIIEDMFTKKNTNFTTQVTDVATKLQQAITASKNDKDILNQAGNYKVKLSSETIELKRNGDNYTGEVTIQGTGTNIAANACSLKDSDNKNVGTVTINQNQKKISISVPANEVTKSITANLKCTVTQNYKTTNIYNCGADVQKLAVLKTASKETNPSAVVKLNINGNIKITKKGKNYKGTTKALEGVKFQIKNSKGKTINASGKEEENFIFTTNDKGEIEVKDIELSNTATENVYKIEEIETLSGYKKNKTIEKVTLSEDKPSFEKTIINETIKVSISKTDATGQKELKGAKLSILDKNEKVLKKCIFDDENDLIIFSDSDEAKACTWVSTNKAKIIEGLPVGEYYLIEELAPTGYTKSTEKIAIQIKETGAVNEKIVMKNALEVKVPDTLSGRSALLLAIAMFDVALGIGIYIYVKNNKIEE